MHGCIIREKRGDVKLTPGWWGVISKKTLKVLETLQGLERALAPRMVVPGPAAGAGGSFPRLETASLRG